MQNKLKLVLISILMLTISVVTQSADFANANPSSIELPELPAPIVIKADGSINPSTAPIQQNGNTFTLTDKIDNTIEIQRPNTVFDGNGFVITKPNVDTKDLMKPAGWLPGVLVANINSVTIRNIVFDGCETGVTVKNATEVTIIQNTIRESWVGIVVLSSSKINIISNNITLTDQSFATGINFLPLNPSASNPNQVTIKGNSITGTSIQVPAKPSQPNQYGIWGGFSGSMIGNTLKNIDGIALYYTGSNNLITGNIFQDNNEGILFTGSPSNCVNNSIYGNNFNQNYENVVVPFVKGAPVNFWDNGTFGNYWSDYTGVDGNNNGIGDTPYILTNIYHDYQQGKEVTVEMGKDNYPLMTPIDVSSSITELPETPTTTPVETSITQNPNPPPTTNSVETTPDIKAGTQLVNALPFIGIAAVIASFLAIAVYFRKKR
jgi:parallel beta-helix repeat protein